MSAIHYFGVRHHGPGCARSLSRALQELSPDCVLVEGPPECDELLWAVTAADMRPPVALLGYCVDSPQLAVYYPFAEFSPEWQALHWAQSNNVTARFIDLPLVTKLAMEKEKQAAAAEQAAQQKNTDGQGGEEPPAEKVAVEARQDPLNWLAQAAGYADGETWWNHMVEERGDGSDLFAAIEEAMAPLRADWEERFKDTADPQYQKREALREAHMRQCVRDAEKEGFARIAVVCGAWHVSALSAEVAQKSDAALLKGLPKVKVHCTWVPWTYRHLTFWSGYGAGIHSPGWYEHLWNTRGTAVERATGWLVRVAGVMRGRDLDCSSASLIEATRLAETLAALRERPAPGLEEMQEATLTVLSPGDDVLMRLIGDELIVGDRLGHVPESVPTVPLQRDLEALQKTLRLKPEANEKILDLDLRNETDLARSHLLHRLRVLDIGWGRMRQVGKSARGTFHEIWELQWRPEFAVSLIEASRWGQTVEQAASVRAIDQAHNAKELSALSALVDLVLLARLQTAIEPVTSALRNRAAQTSDATQLLGALPPLANAYRYGDVRKSDSAMVERVLDELIVRAAISLPLACAALDEAAATAMRSLVLDAHSAIRLRNAEEQSVAWRTSIEQLATQHGASVLLQGVAARLLVDEGHWDMQQAGTALRLHMSAGSEPAHAAAWLEGFLNQTAAVLLHDSAFWTLIDEWLCSLIEDHFLNVLPLVRRTFSTFSAGERRQLGERAARGVSAPGNLPADVSWDEEGAAKALPLLRLIFGVQK